MNNYQIRTAQGTIHTFVVGRTYRVRGDLITNREDSQFGKALCGSTTSSAAQVTGAPATCQKCQSASGGGL